MASGLPEAAICVQDIDVQCVLQFTLIHAAGCALHRHTSRVIHRLELSISFLRELKRAIAFVPSRAAGSAQRVRTGIDKRVVIREPVGDPRLRKYVGKCSVCVRVRRTLGRSPRRLIKPNRKRASLERRRRRRERYPRAAYAEKNRVRAAASVERCIQARSTPERVHRHPNTGARRGRAPASTSVPPECHLQHRRRRYVKLSHPCVLSIETLAKALKASLMILPQVHLRKPCYDFYFL